MGSAQHRQFLDKLIPGNQDLHSKREKVRDKIITHHNNAVVTERGLIVGRSSFGDSERSILERLLTYEENKCPSFSLPNPIHRYSHSFFVTDHDPFEIEADAFIVPTSSNGLGCVKAECDCLNNRVMSRSGPLLREECIRTTKLRDLRPGEFFLTTAPHLKWKFLIHALPPLPDDMMDFLKAVFDECKENSIRRIIIPHSEILLSLVLHWCQSDPYPLEFIFVVSDIVAMKNFLTVQNGHANRP
jgi:hypothetical protein